MIELKHAREMLQEFDYQRKAGGLQNTIGPILEKMCGAKHEERILSGLNVFLALEQGKNTEKTICS